MINTYYIRAEIGELSNYFFSELISILEVRVIPYVYEYNRGVFRIHFKSHIPVPLKSIYLRARLKAMKGE